MCKERRDDLTLFNVYSPPPPGYLVKSLLPQHAELVADEEIWSAPRDWYMDLTSYEQRMQYFRELIQRFDAVGAYETDKPSQPVAWSLRKTGACIRFRSPFIGSKNVVKASMCPFSSLQSF